MFSRERYKFLTKSDWYVDYFWETTVVSFKFIDKILQYNSMFSALRAIANSEAALRE